MDFTKFVDLLDTRTLYFTRSDLYDDPFEGSLTNNNIIYRQSLIQYNIPQNIIDSFAQHNKEIRKIITINCWHMNEYESAAMWKLYLKSNEGIAIKSDYTSLVKCFDSYDEEVHIGKVKYIDYKQYMIPEGNFLNPFLCKRRSFDYERELRAIIIPAKKINEFMKSNPGSFIWKTIIGNGIAVPVDLGCLIKMIFIAPNSQPWFTNLVKSIVKRYGIDIPVIQSSLEDSPVF